METRANYVLIGAFALAGFLGILAFFLWFAKLQLDRQFAYYDIDFSSVSGLSDASDVRFAGLPVGQVVDVRLSPDNDGTVRVRIEIGSDTPVRSDSVATIEPQGVTGVAYVGISAGTPDGPLLAPTSGQDVPMIDAGQSVLQSLSEDAPLIVSETLEIVRNLRELIDDENQQKVQNILENVEQSSEAFAKTLADFSEISDTMSGFATEIDRFNTTLETLTRDVSGTITTAQETLDAITALAEDARGLVSDGSAAIAQAQAAAAAGEAYVTAQLGPATDQLNRSVAELETRLVTLSDNATALVATYAETGQIATRRLVEAEETLAATTALIARIDTTLTSIDTAARNFDGFIVDGAEPLVAELRAATAEATSVISALGETARTDLPGIMGDIRAATASALDVVRDVGGDLTSASGQLVGLAADASTALNDARVTFSNANDTLASINSALVTGDRALGAVERAFAGADRVMNEEVAEIAAGLKSALGQLETTIGLVAADIPSVTEDLRAASRSAEETFALIASTVDQSAPGFRSFATEALPQYGRLAAETRELIDNLDTLVDQISRDPGRFFLDPRAPEFKR
jgi:phospholipid/cholesterol/gamma-HCH transport system substrate-binding protein